MLKIPDGFSFFNEQPAEKPQVAISACLNGEAVRYDGTSKKLETTSSILSKALTLLPICPEVGAGMTTPRPPIQLVQGEHQIEAIGRDDKSLNPTAQLEQFRQSSIDKLSTTLCGYIFKSRSPSCGIGSTPIFSADGQQLDLGSGLQAAYVQQQLPWLPICEEQDLTTEQQCEDFIFHCLLLMDLRTGCEQQGLKAVHRHYLSIINRLPNQQQAALEASLQTQDKERYWEVLLRALAE